MFGIVVDLYTVTNGVFKITGESNWDEYSFQYSAVDSPKLRPSTVSCILVGVGGRAKPPGVRFSQSSKWGLQPDWLLIPPQPVLPYQTLRDGEGFFTTTATAPDAVGTCTTRWDITFTAPGYPVRTRNIL
jgi:hypothetical protein